MRCLLVLLVLITATASASSSDEAIRLINDGFQLFNQKKHQQALSLFQKAHAIDPNNQDAAFNMAASFHAMGLWRECAAAAEKAVKLGRDSVFICFGASSDRY